MASRQSATKGRFSSLLILLSFHLLFYSTIIAAQDNSTLLTRFLSQDHAHTTSRGILSTDTAISTSTSVAFSDAISAASTASAKSSQIASMPPIPLPTGNPRYRQLLELAPGMPPLQRISDDDDSAAPNGAAAAAGSSLSKGDQEDLDTMLKSLKVAQPSLWSRMTRKRSRSLRILCVGDSISQGRQGDWTWRYRVWQWYRANGIDVTFVGPWTGTVKPAPAAPPSAPPLYGSSSPSSNGSFDGLYAAGTDPAWNGSGHFAAWGRAAAVDQYLIKQVVQDYSPDLMLLMLGFNDLGWFYSDPSGTLNSVYNIVQNARNANPSLGFAIANIPQRLSLNRRDLPTNINTYNSILAEAIPYWNSSKSQVALVRLRENYDCDVNNCPAGYDGLHPNALGEYQIAQAFTQTLHDSFGQGSGPLSIPGTIPARILLTPSNFKVQTSPQGVTATWDPVFGAYAYEFWSRIDGLTDFTPGSVLTNRYDQQWPVENATYSMYVRATAGNETGPWTQTLSAVAHPQTAPAPINVYVTPTDNGTTITWDQPTGPYTDSISVYNVITRDLDTDCAWVSGGAFKSSPAVITGLTVGHRYLVALETWNANGEGFPRAAHNVIPGAGRPNTPTNFNLISQDATSVYATWDTMPNAGGYNVWVPNGTTKNGGFVDNGGQTDTCFMDGWLFPGSWNYQFAVSSYNGNLESDAGPVPFPYAPHPTSSDNQAPTPTCPPAKVWCAGGGPPSGPAPEDPSSIGPLPGTS